ncbi:acyltransferase family protein [Burkholderia sp. LA-2-3-30-S1-D2]|uniref:acyltransferase family protein n=1 Tax=Burkholderia sp. LA-2-3-30-S1-D2 TaxID=1637862 RepID=UPI0007520698|nr:acyltransferase [Burkholderia sp. LA-2-3-30-S1-D2]AOI98088.1 hypothetical protein WS66_20765 [Burkholderia sp. LA-2-3-30-S1-D2]KVE14956.1 hypothetical protein WS66_10630 [Burkholderia sp. LA-2-3-30-S1-D2]
MSIDGSRNSRRVFGLDVLRASAVILVLASHTVAHGTPPTWLKWYFGAQGVIGVEIFYVLSGFLIGGILIRSHRAGKFNSPAHVLDFWKRRWARTLPLYAFFLLVYLRFDYHGPADLRIVWPFFVFLQNLAWPMTPFFEHSWSLAVEEWFYLLLPCLFVGAIKVFRSDRHAMLAVGAAFLVVPLISRIAFGAHAHSLSDIDRNIRSIVICRLDSLFIGVFMAYLHIEHPDIFSKMARSWKIPLALFTASTIYFAIGAPGLASNIAIRMMLYPGISVIIAAIIPGAMLLRTSGIKLADLLIGWTSKISYSLYLGHICMLTLVISVFADYRISIDSQHMTAIFYVSLLLAYYAFATLTYTVVERPYIKLRDKVMGNHDERSGSIAVQMESASQTVTREVLTEQKAASR